MNACDIIQKFDEIVRIYQSYSGVPNVLDFVGLNENAHTRVISMLLDYRRKGIPVFLESFLAKISDEILTNLTTEDYRNAEIQIQSNYIDCLIQVGKYAIVFENKIHGARDQIRQIETYIERASKETNIVYAVYLTFTGGDPSQCSLSDEWKATIGERLIKMNFQTHILEWLNDDVLQECKVSDGLLEHSARLYIDHLNGMLGQKNIERQMVTRLSKAVDLELTTEYYRVLQQVLSDLEDQSDDRKLRDYDSFTAAIQVLLREIEARIPYINEDNVAYVLKDMFKNCPPWRERASWIDNCANVAPFVPGYFLYQGCRYLKLAGELSGFRTEIHIRCSADGIQNGPYIAMEPDEADRRFGRERLESIGLVRGQLYQFPLESFNMEKTSLLDVALHIKRLVDSLKTTPSVILPSSSEQ